jgi:hypothetical protein
LETTDEFQSGRRPNLAAGDQGPGVKQLNLARREQHLSRVRDNGYGQNLFGLGRPIYDALDLFLEKAPQPSMRTDRPDQQVHHRLGLALERLPSQPPFMPILVVLPSRPRTPSSQKHQRPKYNSTYAHRSPQSTAAAGEFGLVNTPMLQKMRGAPVISGTVLQ